MKKLSILFITCFLLFAATAAASVEVYEYKSLEEVYHHDSSSATRGTNQYDQGYKKYYQSRYKSSPADAKYRYHDRPYEPYDKDQTYDRNKRRYKSYAQKPVTKEYGHRYYYKEYPEFYDRYPHYYSKEYIEYKEYKRRSYYRYVKKEGRYNALPRKTSYNEVKKSYPDHPYVHKSPYPKRTNYYEIVEEYKDIEPKRYRYANYYNERRSSYSDTSSAYDGHAFKEYPWGRS